MGTVTKLFIAGLLLFACLHTPALAQTTGGCALGQATADLDVGNVRARLYNLGGLFWIGGHPVYEVPKGSGKHAIFASSLWIGGLVNDELRLSASTYSDWEFWPGPLDANGNPPTDCSVYDRIFLVSWYDLQQLEETGTATPDIADWPWQLGAPVKDGDGISDNYDLAAGDRPDLIGDQMAWWVMNDAGNLHYTSETPPIGLEARVTAYAFARADLFGNTTFYRYELVYEGQAPLESAYFGIWSDPDLGAGGDDYIGSDSLRGLGFVYNGDEFDDGSSGYGDAPPALGYELLAGPVADTDGLDNNYDGNVDEPGERLRMSVFMFYNSNSSVQGNPYLAIEYYRYLRGLWRDGRPITVGGSGLGFSETPTRFMYPADPPAFWSEDDIDRTGTRNPPSDRRFLMSTGPFTMNPGDTEVIDFAIIWSSGDDRLDSVLKLKRDAEIVYDAYQNNFVFANVEPPASAPLLLTPGDGAGGQPTSLTLSWTDVDDAWQFEWQIATDVSFTEIVATGPAFAVNYAITEEPIETGRNYYWRVRGVNAGGSGPWSQTFSFTTSEEAIVFADGAGPVVYLSSGDPAFVEDVGPGGADPCAPPATSTAGCDEIGGNFVYPSFNSTGEYLMYRQGTGPEGSLLDFAPNEYEIRFTAAGGYAVYPFLSDDEVDNHIRVPFEIWDIGDVGPHGISNPNDPSDDVRLIPNLLGDATPGDGQFAYGEIESVFGLGIGATDRVYAYYPVSGSTYDDWEAIVAPNVDAAPGGIWNDVAGLQWDLIDFSRGRPLQRIIFDEGAGNGSAKHPPEGVVIRFYTQPAEPPSRPVPSAPADGRGDLVAPALLAWSGLAGKGPSGATIRHRVQVAPTADFTEVLLDTTTAGSRWLYDSIPEARTYYWRVLTNNGLVVSDWSDVWSFTVTSATAVDDVTIPDRFVLRPNYPNPFSTSTTIGFDVARPGPVEITVYDVLGRRVAVLADELYAPGRYETTWNASRHASGTYFYRMEASGFRMTKSMIVLR